LIPGVSLPDLLTKVNNPGW